MYHKLTKCYDWLTSRQSNPVVNCAILGAVGAIFSLILGSILSGFLILTPNKDQPTPSWIPVIVLAPIVESIVLFVYVISTKKISEKFSILSAAVIAAAIHASVGALIAVVVFFPFLIYSMQIATEIKSRSNFQVIILVSISHAISNSILLLISEMFK